MATNYELPEEINEKRLRTLGRQVEMQTYKTNAASEGEAIESDQLGELLLKIACVGTKDNVAKEPLQWIGPGKIFESEAALDEFCKDHGFVDHFEIKSRDWESGEKSVFGQAVNCLLDEILQSEQKSEDLYVKLPSSRTTFV
ncbi:hypothetical protein OS493_007625 [Desmophyllum pertusum]|uniref:Uncharacterized protein n=1 Tax=Desmophyllum pertusum TaxID=174260 RepID=A0A9W9YUL7_9CNID|nr:hypothetical protein OS493_007625 [Desmophyllum pertusum]